VIENNGDWDWFGTLRLRGGVAVDQALVYVTAGVAAVGANYFYGWTTPPDPAFDVVSDDVQYGFTAGAGVEYALSDSMSVKLEYLYLGLPTTSVTEVDESTYDFTSSAHIARAGLNFHF